MDDQIGQLNRMIAAALQRHQDAVVRVTEIPGFGVDSAHQLIAEIGVDAETFPSAGAFASWAGLCPGSNVSAEENQSSRSAEGNRFVRRILTQAAQAAVKKKGSHFQALFRRFLLRQGYNGAIWAVARRLGRLVWKILHDGVATVSKARSPTQRRSNAAPNN